ncbi:MAG: hypothetical protein LBB49_03125 [Gracilibacteraceae bacterium]|nr:hypothetical protein [Gracilibacteraceae bacterium]
MAGGISANAHVIPWGTALSNRSGFPGFADAPGPALRRHWDGRFFCGIRLAASQVRRCAAMVHGAGRFLLHPRFCFVREGLFGF